MRKASVIQTTEAHNTAFNQRYAESTRFFNSHHAIC